MKSVKVLELSEWQTPASNYQVAIKGSHKLDKHIYQPGFYTYHGIDGFMFFSVKKPLVATKLLGIRPSTVTGMPKWGEWMIDSPTDYRAMQKYAERAKGRVLTTGLGLGLVTHELCKNPEVSSITVIELSQDVIDLVVGYLPEDSRINIVCSDLWDFIARDNSSWDSMIIDIWVYYGLEQQLDIYRKEIIPASKMLKEKYPDAWVVFHGFAGMPTEEQLDKVAADGDGSNPLVIDPLIYGLGAT